MLVAVVAAGGLVSCKRKVDVVLEQPESTVASLIKAYQGEDVEAYGKIADDFYFTLQERALACNDRVYSQIFECQEKAPSGDRLEFQLKRELHKLDCLKAGPECGCKVPTEGGRSYVTSLGHRVLSTAVLSAEACTIKEVLSLSMKELDKYGDAFAFYSCSELKDNDKFSVAEVRCQDVNGPLRVFMVQRPEGWKVIAYGGEGYLSLGARAAQKMVDEQEKKKLGELNKYLK
ncbi:uncharacterized protein SOCE26_051370 [Sorangium cellulosum]|uniref:Uncharacterized protein n=1 Tax=Sorangium cellulosum TaxID=56 RepID=A0A2L0EWP6_SORCE|nr:uncharacterized protein SOCE26_051370 [Sorangium cellulosum]